MPKNDLQAEELGVGEGLQRRLGLEQGFFCQRQLVVMSSYVMAALEVEADKGDRSPPILVGIKVCRYPCVDCLVEGVFHPECYYLKQAQPLVAVERCPQFHVTKPILVVRLENLVDSFSLHLHAAPRRGSPALVIEIDVPPLRSTALLHLYITHRDG